jgi:thimet oligopeptidase
LLGHFYLDLYPRPDKFNHAAAFPLIKRFENKGEVLPAAAAMVTNFAKAEKGKPSLLAHNEIVTFFHEFGHVMHNMCSEAKYSGFAGTSVEQDFVEMPSQMLENWMWQKEILKKVSKHYKTGKPLPDDMIEAKIKSKNDF